MRLAVRSNFGIRRVQVGIAFCQQTKHIDSQFGDCFEGSGHNLEGHQEAKLVKFFQAENAKSPQLRSSRALWAPPSTGLRRCCSDRAGRRFSERRTGD